MISQASPLLATCIIPRFLLTHTLVRSPFVNPSMPIFLHRRCLGWVHHGLRPLFFKVKAFDCKLYVTIERSATVIKGRSGGLYSYK